MLQLKPAIRKNWLSARIKEAKKHQDLAYQTVNELVMKERVGRKIILEDDTELTDFFSCSYLGLDLDPRVIKAATNNIEKCGVTFPAARTRIQAQSFCTLENLLNTIFCDAHTILFGSLHLGHLGFLPLLGSGEMPSYPLNSKGAHFLLDKTVHSSIQINRALMEQFGPVDMFNFQKLNNLEEAMKNSYQQKRTPILIADSIGSMGGVNDVKILLELAERYQGYVYLDDAHGMSIYGQHGCGYTLDCLDRQFHPRLALATSLSKAFGAVGAVVVLPTAQDVDVMKKFAPTYVFGGPPPLSIIDSAIASAEIHLSGELNMLQRRLWKNVEYFDQLTSSLDTHILNAKQSSPIRGLMVGNEFMAIEFALFLRKCGYAVTTAMYPTVAQNQSILRIGLSAPHSRQEIRQFSSLLKEIVEVIQIHQLQKNL